MANEKRLIDANALEELENLDYVYDPVRDGCAWYRAADVWACIEREPTVDAVEVVHGYWIDSTTVDHVGRIIEHGIDCSVCDSVFKDDSREVVKHWKERFVVCPFCGALMDGDGNG